MPSLDVFHRSSSHGVAIPECPRCHRPAGVGEVTLPDLPFRQASNTGAAKGAVMYG